MRKTLKYTICDNNRDKDKTFLITEMSASRAESWAIRAILALMNNGANLPEGFDQLGMAAMAEIGLKALSALKWEIAEPLLSEMFECVQFIPDTRKPQIVRILFDEDIEEITTRLKLRAEVWKLHMDFLQTAVPSISPEPEIAAVDQRGSRIIKTYRPS